MASEEAIVGPYWDHPTADQDLETLRAEGINARLIIAGSISREEIPSWVSNGGNTAKSIIAVPKDEFKRASLGLIRGLD